MVHGYPGRPQDFRFLFEHFEDVHCIALAMPNLDISTTKTNIETTSITARRRAIVEFMDHMGIKEAILMGHSMGGPIVSAVTRHYPERILGLALISTVGAQEYRIFRRSKPRWGYRLISLPLIGWLFKPLMTFAFKQLGFPKGISPSALFYVLHCANDFSFRENSQNMEFIKQPVLNIWCSDDPFVEPELYTEVDGLFSTCETLYFEDGGHNPQRTKAEVIAKKFRTWLSRHYPSTEKRNLVTNS
jgi:pimeloyl-ACP methyl ester carboxylesterase